jgi:hypothetical protein
MGSIIGCSKAPTDRPIQSDRYKAGAQPSGIAEEPPSVAQAIADSIALMCAQNSCTLRGTTLFTVGKAHTVEALHAPDLLRSAQGIELLPSSPLPRHLQ